MVADNDNYIPHAMASNLRCCCGQPSCAYLDHNNAALGGLEKDLETAAKLGQVRWCILCVIMAALLLVLCPTLKNFIASGNTTHFMQSVTSTCVVAPSSTLPSIANMARTQQPLPRRAPLRPSSTGLTFALQALLTRHESYIASSSAERDIFTAQIVQLECDKSALEHTNTCLVRENRELLDHLESLNTTIADSDAHIASLAATLAEAQFELKRLTALVVRTEELERQLEQMEIGRSQLERDVKAGEESERSAVWRWREAEGRVRSMEEQLERIEREARAERERHVELMARMERKRGVERDLQLERAAGILKGAATVKKEEGNGGGGGTSVVSHFVRDILQDNANLQAGIVELRELLQGSNEEVQNLRELVMVHQPISSTIHGGGQDGGEARQATPLNEELEWLAGPNHVPQQLHVHHHYHAKLSTKKDRTPLTRRGSKKRAAIGLSTPTPGSPMMQNPSPRHASQPSPLPGPLGPPIAYIPTRKSRWSVQSATTGSSTISSLPNSPRSEFDHRNSSIFDRIESMSETSRPTSPESGGYATPQFGWGCRKGHVSEVCLSPFAELPEDVEGTSLPSSRQVIRHSERGMPLVEPPQKADSGDTDIAKEEEIDPLDISAPTEAAPRSETGETSMQDIQQTHESASEMLLELGERSREPHNQQRLIQPSLRRSNSHESLVSISGMDIHIPKNSSSQIFALGRGFSSSAIPTSGTLPSSRPVASIAEVNASSLNPRSASDSASASSISMLSGLVALGNSSSPQPSANAKGEWQGGLGRLVGGWVMGKWGIAPMASTGDLQAHAAGTARAKSIPFAGRPPGINQKGVIPGLRPPVRTPSEVHARVVNEGLLRESLAE
jgi:hypothetical protein